MSETVMIYTTWPDAETAERVGAEAVAARLAACVNVLAPMVSIYRWEGAIDRAVEIPMILKTNSTTGERLRDFILARHPHDTPAIMALRVSADGSSPAFLDWIAAETVIPKGDPDQP